MSKYKKLIRILIVSITLMLMFYTNVYGTTINKLDAKGEELLTVIRSVGYWLILFMALKDVIKAGMNKDLKDIGSVIMKYCLLYACLWLLPFLLRAMEGIV